MNKYKGGTSQIQNVAAEVRTLWTPPLPFRAAALFITELRIFRRAAELRQSTSPPRYPSAHPRNNTIKVVHIVETDGNGCTMSYTCLGS